MLAKEREDDLRSSLRAIQEIAEKNKQHQKLQNLLSTLVRPVFQPK